MRSLQNALFRLFLSIFGCIILACVQAILARMDFSAFPSFPDAGKMTEHEREIASNVIQPENISERLADIGGLAAIKDDLLAQVLLPLQHAGLFDGSPKSRPPRGILLHGKPGTGKTMLAKAIAAEAGRPFLSLGLSSLENKWFGETSKLLQACFSYARKHQPCVLFFDEIDGMMRTRTQDDQSCVYGMKTEFLTHMDGMKTQADDTFVVIACTNNIDMLDPAVRRRLPQVYRIDAPDEAELFDILKLYLRDTKIRDQDLRELAGGLRPGCTGSDIAELVRSAWAERRRSVLTSKRVQKMLKQGTVDKEKMAKLIGQLQYQNLQSAAAARNLVRP